MIKVLHVEDDDFIARMIARAAKPWEFKIVRVRTAKAARDWLECAWPDVCLLDWNVMDGTTEIVYREAISMGLKVIVHTAAEWGELIAIGVAETDIIAKTARVATLLDRVREAAKGGIK